MDVAEKPLGSCVLRVEKAYRHRMTGMLDSRIGYLELSGERVSKLQGKELDAAVDLLPALGCEVVTVDVTPG